ncbi:MAG: uroporphyrinogen-III C-methyltransferase, partial [Gammaproteobacteria bacterium]|nr:uroporphyrinogen-III C-methyltransferase [Gammaproteobacteria bacterium]
DWADLPSAIWKDIRGLVVVRRADKPIEPLQAPTEAWYLRQILQLKLEQARLSLLRHETALFHQLLDEAAYWLTANFDAESAAVKGMLESLQNLQQADLQPSLPDISDSLRVLRQYMQSLGIEVEAAQREGDTQ